MDENTLYLGIAILSFLCGLYAIRSFSAVKTREIDRKIAASRRMSQVRAGAKSARNESEKEIPVWLEEVAEELGVEDYLDSDEMPPELAKLLPLAKGFIDSGGLTKILGAGGKPGSPGTEGQRLDETGAWF